MPHDEILSMTATTVACFGELLLRLSAPGAQPLMYSRQFDWHVGGAEANVGVGLAQFGHRVHMISALPHGRLGDGVIAQLRSFGVEVSKIARDDGRIGLYFHTSGAGYRAGEIIYDRWDSVFSRGAQRLLDPDKVLADIGWLHVSGVTPAIGDESAKATCAMVEAAAERGLRVSYDFNHRATLWARWGGDPTPYLKRIVAAATHLFANDHDLGRVIDLPAANPQRELMHAKRAFDALPRLQLITSAFRTTASVESHTLAAEVVTRNEQARTEPVTLHNVVDRIGSGDAYAAGIIHASVHGLSAQEAAEIGLASAILKHSIPGDFPQSSLDDIAVYRSSGRDVRR